MNGQVGDEVIPVGESATEQARGSELRGEIMEIRKWLYDLEIRVQWRNGHENSYTLDRGNELFPLFGVELSAEEDSLWE